MSESATDQGALRVVAVIPIDPARAAEAAPLLTRLLAAADAGHRDGSAIEAQLLLALAQQAAGDTSLALATLGEALARADQTPSSRRIMPSDNDPASASPRASATPSADAPREYAIDL